MSDPTPTPPAPAAPAAEAAPTPPPAAKPNGPDGFPAETPIADMAPEQAVAYWKHKARKHEDAANTYADKAKRFDEFEESQKTELQKASDAAAAAKAEADATKAELARMQAAVKHGLTADDLDLLGTHGTPDEIEARAAKLATRLKAVEANRPPVDFGGGDRGGDINPKAAQLTRDDLKRMNPEEIVQAEADGRLSDLLKST